MVNGGKLVKPSLIKNRKVETPNEIVSRNTSKKLSDILRKVVTSENGTASLADKKMDIMLAVRRVQPKAMAIKKIELIHLFQFFPLKNLITLYLLC